MRCETLPEESEYIVGEYASRQAGKALKAVGGVRNNPDGVAELVARSISAIYNSWVRWITGYKEIDEWEARPIPSAGGKWGITVGEETDRLLRRRQNEG